jgi:microcystin degradation protein MlrC
VFIAAFAHETNSFSPIPTSRQSFEEGLLYRPARAPDVNPETAFFAYGDFARIARERGHERVLSLAAWAHPSGPTVKPDYEALRDEILDDLRRALPVDAVLLMLHGSQMAVGYDDCEGDLLTRIRAIVGEKVPVGVELDLHCNVTDAMLNAATVIMACKEYPHTDFADRALELYDIIERTVRGTLAPRTVKRRVPMMSKFHTTREPMASFVRKVKAMEGRDGVLSISLCHGFLWSDMPDAGASVLIVTDGERGESKRWLDELAEEFFALRKDVYGRYLSVDAALDRALAEGRGPVVIADVSDNPGGGAPGDSTFLLKAVLERGIQGVGVAVIWDPVAVQTAMLAGVGARIPMRIGGKTGIASGAPLDVDAEVLAVAENPTQRGLEPKRREPLGPSAAIRVAGVDIVLISRRQQAFSPDCFTELGLDPRAQRILIVKSAQHFQTYFADLASTILYCDGPGALNSNLAALPFKKLRRPIWPLDDLTGTNDARESCAGVE